MVKVAALGDMRAVHAVIAAADRRLGVRCTVVGDETLSATPERAAEAFCDEPEIVWSVIDDNGSILGVVNGHIVSGLSRFHRGMEWLWCSNLSDRSTAPALAGYDRGRRLVCIIAPLRVVHGTEVTP
jgi:hypothetical protein